MTNEAPTVIPRCLCLFPQARDHQGSVFIVASFTLTRAADPLGCGRAGIRLFPLPLSDEDRKQYKTGGERQSTGRKGGREREKKRKRIERVRKTEVNRVNE